MAQPCFDEIGEKMFDYNEFENMLRSVLLEVGYNDSQIIRWESKLQLNDSFLGQI